MFHRRAASAASAMTRSMFCAPNPQSREKNMNAIHRAALQTVTAVAFLTALSGCGDPAGSSLPCNETRVSGAPETMFVGETVSISTYSVDSKSGQKCTGFRGKSLRFSTSDSRILSVTASMQLMALSPGTASFRVGSGSSTSRAHVVRVLAKESAAR